MIRFAFIAATLVASVAAAQPLTTAFTFQGELDNGASPANGIYDIRFTLYDAPTGGSQLGVLCSDNVAVANGKFTVQLDFGAQFTGQQRFLEVQARPDTGLTCSNSTGFTVLAPRQSLTATPNASYAANTAQLGGQSASFYTNAANLTGTLNDGILSTNIPRLNFTNSFSGNMGVGMTGAPAARLEISGSDSTTTGTGAALRLDNTASGGSSWFMRAGATGNNTPAGGFSILSNAGVGLNIDSSGRVGIGTNAPSGTLELDAFIPDFRLRSNLDQGGWLMRESSGTSFLGYYNTGASAWGAVPAGGFKYAFGHNINGVVGSLAETAPNTYAFRNMLDDGNGNLAIDNQGLNSGTVANTLRLGGTGSGEAIGSKRTSGGNQNGLDFYTASAQRLAITNSGNVGIGTTAPSSLLEVQGSTPQLRIRNTGDQGGSYAYNISNATFFGFYNPGATTWGSVPAGGSKSTFALQNQGLVASVAETSPGSGAYLPRNILDDGSGGATFSATTSIATLNVTGASDFAGVNTFHANTTFNNPVTLSSGANAGFLNLDTAGVATSTGLFQNQTNVLRFGSLPSGEGITSKRTSGGNQFGIDLYAGNNPRLSITNAGNVGIGTSSPVSKLHLLDGTFEITASAGGQVFSNISANHNGQIFLTNATNHYIALMSESGLDATKGGQVIIADQNGVARAGFQMQTGGTGIVFADVKNFVANNPDDPKTQLYYACVEGPEAAMYCRGTGHLEVGHAHIDLPRHFAAMAAEKGLTVQITPLSADCMGIAVTKKSTDSFEVTELFKGQNTCDFDWEVKAVRKGYEDYQVVRPAGLLNPKPIVSQDPGPKTE